MQAIIDRIENLKDDAGFNGSTAERREALCHLQMAVADAMTMAAHEKRVERDRFVGAGMAVSEFAKEMDEVETQLKHYRYSVDPPAGTVDPEFTGL